MPNLLLLAARGILLLVLGAGLWGSVLGAPQPGPVAHGATGDALPAGLARLLAPQLGEPRQDVQRLQGARAQWAGDSLGRLLVFSRLGTVYHDLRQPDSSLWHLQRAWRAGAPAYARRQPMEVLTLAEELANRYYERAAYDSARRYFRVATAIFRTAGFDSVRATGRVQLPSTRWFAGSANLAETVAGAGLASRRLGDVPQALRYYERAEALYRQQRNLGGLVWAQGLIGETYTELGDEARAAQAYEQALRYARTYARQQPEGSPALAGLLLDYYLPLLLAQPRQWPYAARLAAEATRALQVPFAGRPPRTDPVHDAVLLAQLQLVPAEIALRQGQPGAASGPLAGATYWLGQAAAQGRHRGEPDESYPAVQAQAWGLRAWQQHPRAPAAARRLLGQAAALLGAGHLVSSQARSRQQLADYCLAIGEYAQAVTLLHPLGQRYQRPLSPLPLSQVTARLMRAYAGLGRYDSAYHYSQRTQALVDTVRTARHFAALAATEARFRTREQASQIRVLTERDRQQALRVRLAAASAALLALLLLLAGLAWRTTRRLNGQLAAQAARLQQLDEAKNQFFANVSHELRTPLMLVLGPLRQALSQAKPPALRELLNTSVRHGQHLRALIDRILDLTKLEAGKVVAQPVATPLAALLRGLVTQFEPVAAAAGIRLRGPLGLPEELVVHLDADKLGQILTNLLANALQHTPAGGSVRLTVAQPGPDQYALTVQDTGPGIAASEQAQVFERFYQSPQRQARGGTGLGLALSRELAQLLGGTLTLVSQEGAGAAFTLTLRAERLPATVPLGYPGLPAGAGAPSAPADAPAHAAAPDLGATAPAAQSRPARPVVLLVEDHAELRAYVRALLAPACEVLEAADGQQALAVLARTPVDLVASDAMMPHLSGLELLQALKRDPARRDLPFLMLTARADDAHRLSALATGVDDYLIKPFEDAELLTRVHTLLARRLVRQHFAALPVAEEIPAPAAPASKAPEVLAPAPAANPDLGAPAAQLAQWQALVAGHLEDPAFGPAELAGLLLLSERTLYRRLGELAGLTPAAWLRELRLAHARRLLEAGDYGSVATVAEAAGFANVKAFSTRYAERFGRRPSSYLQ